MADPDRNVDTGDDTDVGPDGGSRRGVSRWQKVVGIIGLVLLLLVGIRMFGGGGLGGGFDHGPSGDTPPAGVTDDDGQAPPGDGGHRPPVDFDHG